MEIVLIYDKLYEYQAPAATTAIKPKSKRTNPIMTPVFFLIHLNVYKCIQQFAGKLPHPNIIMFRNFLYFVKKHQQFNIEEQLNF